MKFKTAGDRHSTEDGRMAEIIFDLFLRARAKTEEEKVTGPSSVAEMIKELPQATVYEVARCFQARLLGRERAPDCWVF